MLAWLHLYMHAHLCVQKLCTHLLHHFQRFMGAQQGAASASPLMVTHMIHGCYWPFVFITPPRRLAVASSELRAMQAHLGQNERKEFEEERFFGTTGNKGAWFGHKGEKLVPGRRLLFPPWLWFRGGQGFIRCQCLGKV